eukprot:CAMPEP_0206455402 /NCGR_PEP_ID=MMETSP0324_2-20121206/21729_1 /ASSEMBLY_ACC=CAM_ASM_000836 /TAXON_ID=2866 /ORGANISM="Crypthecodinium cohnii, Strain Seligo" /LENGTH=101 /DNA_ID=CAMNT_0053926095 /DNA_START=689 /DNA_END=991 /DNA_ORIENTATION=-
MGVGSFAVDVPVQAGILPVLVHPGSHHQLDGEEDDGAHHCSIDRHCNSRDELSQEQLEAATIEEPPIQREATSQHGANKAADAVAGEGVQAVVDARGELEE